MEYKKKFKHKIFFFFNYYFKRMNFFCVIIVIKNMNLDIFIITLLLNLSFKLIP